MRPRAPSCWPAWRRCGRARSPSWRARRRGSAMCGIAGLVNLDGRPVAPGEVRAMCSVLSHRGPDEEGLYIGSGAGLGMRRLSIIDLATGSQPLSSEDRTIWAVCNGEIYNHRELRRDLVRLGHRFATGSDAEAIVH